MAEVNVENMEENAELFVEKMGFAHDSEGLEMTDDQLVNFLLLCHQMQYGVNEEEMAEEDGEMKVKVMKIGHGGDVHEMMNEILGG
jgi:extradiol dioxygenase family protein